MWLFFNQKYIVRNFELFYFCPFHLKFVTTYRFLTLDLPIRTVSSCMFTPAMSDDKKGRNEWSTYNWHDLHSILILRINDNQLSQPLSWLEVAQKCETKIGLFWSLWQDAPLLTITLNFDFTSSRVSQNFLGASCLGNLYSW